MDIKLIEPLKHNGEDCEVNSVITVDAKEGKNLIAKGYAEKADGKEVKDETNTGDAETLKTAKVEVADLKAKLATAEGEIVTLKDFNVTAEKDLKDSDAALKTALDKQSNLEEQIKTLLEDAEKGSTESGSETSTEETQGTSKKAETKPTKKATK